MKKPKFKVGDEVYFFDRYLSGKIVKSKIKEINISIYYSFEDANSINEKEGTFKTKEELIDHLSKDVE